MTLNYCNDCIQMTNHLDNICQKCKKGNAPSEVQTAEERDKMLEIIFGASKDDFYLCPFDEKMVNVIIKAMHLYSANFKNKHDYLLSESSLLKERVRELEEIVENAHDYASRAVWINEKQDNGQEFYEYISKVSFLAGEKEAHNKAVQECIDAIIKMKDFNSGDNRYYFSIISELEKLKK